MHNDLYAEEVCAGTMELWRNWIGLYNISTWSPQYLKGLVFMMFMWNSSIMDEGVIVKSSPLQHWGHINVKWIPLNYFGVSNATMIIPINEGGLIVSVGEISATKRSKKHCSSWLDSLRILFTDKEVFPYKFLINMVTHLAFMNLVPRIRNIDP